MNLMEIYDFFGLIGRNDSNKLDSFFKKNGLTPLMKEAEIEVEQKMVRFNIIKDRAIIKTTRFEIYYSPEPKMLVFLSMDRERFFTSPILFQLKILCSKTSFDKIRASLMRNPLFESIKEGSIIERFALKELNINLNKSSPNGKVCQRKEVTSILKKVYEDDTREIIKKIYDTYRTNVVPLGAIEGLFKGKESAIKKITNDKSLVNKKFVPVCKDCQFPSNIYFESRQDSEKNLKNTEFECPLCHKNNRAISELITLKKETISSVKGGIWLEKMVEEIFKKFSTEVWLCKMFGVHELDVVALLNEKKILVECKDSSFGQNDLWALMRKGQDLGADIVFIVTTMQVHPNVKKAIEEFNEGEDKDREFILVVESKSNELKKVLETKIKKIKEVRISNLMSQRIPSHYTYRIYKELTSVQRGSPKKKK